MDPFGPARRLWAVHTLSFGVRHHSFPTFVVAFQKARERAFGAHVALGITRKMINWFEPFLDDQKIAICRKPLPSREILDAAIQATCLSAKESAAAAEECNQQQGAYRHIDGRCNHPEKPTLGASVSLN